MHRPFSTVYDAVTQSVRVVENMADLAEAVHRMRFDLVALTDALDTIGPGRATRPS